MGCYASALGAVLEVEAARSTPSDLSDLPDLPKTEAPLSQQEVQVA
jgi:hypothetical protein